MRGSDGEGLTSPKEWYANVDAVEAPDPHTAVFRLRRPQPSLVAMLASGYSPVIPAHVPFKLKEWKRGQSVELVRTIPTSST